MSDDMRNLRDARLRRALDHAPDAHMTPDAAVRASVLRAAHEAVQGAATAPPSVAVPMPWWKRLLGGSGRAPWNAAFATVLLAGFITVMWHGEEIPDARVDSAAPQAETTPQSPTPSKAENDKAEVAQADRNRAATSEAASKARQASAERTDRAAAEKRAIEKQSADGKVVKREAELRAEPSPQAQRERRGDSLASEQMAGGSTATAPAGPAAPPASAPAPAPVESRSSAPYSPAPAAPPPPPAVAAAPAMAPRPSPQAMASAAPAPSAGLAERRSQALMDQELSRNLAPSSGPQPWIEAWNSVRTPVGASSGASSASIGRDSAPELAVLLRALQQPGQAQKAAQQTRSETLPTRPDARIELLRDGEALGTFEIYADRWRFVSRFSTTPGPRTGPLNAAQRELLQSELRRLGLVTTP